MPGPITVVVPTRDRPEQLVACLEALRAATGPDDEVIVVDSASTDPAVGQCARALGATVVRCEQPGAARARNAGVDAADRPVIAFVDDDVRVAPGWGAAIAAAFDDPDVAFVTGRVAVPAGQEGRQREVAIKDDETAARLDRSTPSPLGSSANLAVRRSALAGVGGFDEALGGGARFQAAEDLDLFDRLLAAGCVGRYEPAAVAYHDQWRSRRQLLVLDWRYGLGAGARLAKLARTDRARGRRAAREGLWDDGVVVLARAIRARQEFLIATTALRLGGAIAGFVSGIFVRLRAGQYAARG